MARVSSTVFMMFLAAPVLAPSIGQGILGAWPWPAIFVFLALLGGITWIWVAVRLPETLPVDRRHPFGPRPLGEALRYIASHPSSLLYMVAMMLLFGGLLTYVATMPQVFSDVFHAPERMALTFAATAGLMGLASFLNAQIVERFGMHRISHSALLGLLCVSGVHIVVALGGHETIRQFTVLQGLTMMGFSLSLSNFGAIAMQPMGRVAGSAASLQGMSMGLGGAVISAVAGSFWQGSVALLPAAFFVTGLIALGGILVAERGRLFAQDHPRSGTV
jgi:DHA1 family bicyclomycin/chloramphenicol resistance-like MFS transporter